MKTPALILGIGLLAAAAALPASAKDEKKKTTPLRYAHAYATALEEAKDRGCVVFANFHIDHWGGCAAQHRSVLENDDFIAWANENVVIVLGHDGATGDKEQHKSVEETDSKSKEKKQVCPLYDGLTCDEHKAIRRDVSAPKDGFGKIDVPGGFPNTWMVGPDGTVEQVDGKDQQIAKNIQEGLVAFQKKFEGKPLPWKKYDAYRKSLADGDKALDEGKWKPALAAYAKVDVDTKKLPKGLQERVKAKLDAANEKVVAKFAEIRDGEGDAAAKSKAVKALRAEVGAKFSTGTLAVVADLDTWIKENATPASPPK